MESGVLVPAVRRSRHLGGFDGGRPRPERGARRAPWLVRLAAVGALFSLARCGEAQSTSPSFRLSPATVNGGGGTSVSPAGTNFRATGSIGQESTIGTSSSFGSVLQSGFWGFLGSGLVPVLLSGTKNPGFPDEPDFAWTGNNPNYSLYRSADCSAVYAGGPLLVQAGRTFTDAAPLPDGLACYSVLATAPGPIAPTGADR